VTTERNGFLGAKLRIFGNCPPCTLVAAWLLAFTLSLDDLVIASFVSGPGASTLPMVVFSKVRLGISPDINALATLMILIMGLGGVFGFWQMRRSTNRRST
jgi:putrescine transport system permease protein